MEVQNSRLKWPERRGQLEGTEGKVGQEICCRLQSGTASRSHVISASGLRIPHSQSSKTRQPCCNSSFLFLISRFTFCSNFERQNSSRELGLVAYLHPGCLCQKQP